MSFLKLPKLKRDVPLENESCIDIRNVFVGENKTIVTGILKRPLSENESVVMQYDLIGQREAKISSISKMADNVHIIQVQHAEIGDNVDICFEIRTKKKVKCIAVWKYIQINEKKEDQGNMSEYTKWDELEKELNSEESKREYERKPNIFVCGATGVGKSSLILDLFGGTEEEKQKAVGTDGKPHSRGINWYNYPSMNLCDSEGYEIGGERQEYYYDNIVGYVEKNLQEVDEIWYCISAGKGKIFEVDEKVIGEFRDLHIPVLIILTQVDMTTEEELEELTRVIKSIFTDIQICTYTTDRDIPEYAEKEKILNWALEYLPDQTTVKAKFVKNMDTDIDTKEIVVKNHIVAKYTALAAGIVTGTSWIPVPFSDSVALMALQVKMTSDILNAYNIDNSFALRIVGTKAVSMLGKTLAGQLFGMIPVFGAAAKGVANVTVATTVTATLGLGVSHWAKETAGKSGNKELFSNDELEAAFSWAENNGMVDAVLNRIPSKSQPEIVADKKKIFPNFLKGIRK